MKEVIYIVKLNEEQTAAMGLAFDALLKTTGVQFLSIVSDIHKQVAEQVKKNSDPNDQK